MERVPDEFVAFAHRLADADGAVLRRWFRAPIGSEAKADESPVTRADREAETAVRDLIRRHYPDHGIDGEEFGTENLDAEWVWLIDPLDGTKTFLKGRPNFGVLIGLAHGGRYALGVIDHPALGERWIGADGHGTRHDGAEVRTRPCAGLGEAWLSAVGPNLRGEEDVAGAPRLRAVCRRVLYGLECYSYGLIASGRFDLAIDGELGRDDIAPLEPVVRNAGGVLTDPTGNAVDMRYEGPVLAAGDPALHDAALEILNG